MVILQTDFCHVVYPSPLPLRGTIAENRAFTSSSQVVILAFSRSNHLPLSSLTRIYILCVPEQTSQYLPSFFIRSSNVPVVWRRWRIHVNISKFMSMNKEDFLFDVSVITIPGIVSLFIFLSNQFCLQRIVTFSNFSQNLYGMNPSIDTGNSLQKVFPNPNIPDNPQPQLDLRWLQCHTAAWWAPCLRLGKWEFFEQLKSPEMKS